jgi:hypothetical protein
MESCTAEDLADLLVGRRRVGIGRKRLLIHIESGEQRRQFFEGAKSRLYAD